jgi:hypothetical protein
MVRNENTGLNYCDAGNDASLSDSEVLARLELYKSFYNDTLYLLQTLSDKEGFRVSLATRAAALECELESGSAP